MKRIKKLISGVVLMTMLIAPIITAVAVPQKAKAEEPVLISIVPSAETVAPGELFTVDIVINPNGNEIWGVDADFEFGSSLSEVNSVSVIPSFWPFPPMINNNDGIVTDIIATFMPPFMPPPSGIFTFATINMIASTENTGVLDLSLTFLDIGPLPFTPSLPIASSITIMAAADTTPSTITSVTSTTDDGAYKAGDSVDINITFDEEVIVDTTGGVPQLELETGDTDQVVDYFSGSGADTLTFIYTIQEGDNTLDLDYTSSDALTLNGGTIKDTAENDAILTLPNSGEASSLGANKDIVIDTNIPIIENYTLNGLSENVVFSPDLPDEIEIAINASEEVDWTSIKIENVDDSGIYKIWQPGADCDGNSQCVKIWDGSLSGGTLVGGEYKIKVNVKDAAGNIFDDYLVPYTVTVDTIPPVITLLGNNLVNIYAGTIYADSGATALDDVDGNITNNIAVVNPVDIATAGTYAVTYNVSDAAGNPAQQAARTVVILPVEQGQAPIEQNMIVSSSAPEILIGDNAPSSASINVPLEITNAQINVSALVSGDSVKFAVIPLELTINSSTSAGEVNMQIPQGIQISGNSSWTGEINLPQVQENTSVNIASDPGYNSEVSSVIEIGFGDILLNFNKAVRIKIAGQAGKYVGYARDGVFTQITDICGADSQAAGDALSEGAECKIDIGSDLIIWTKHFTKFAAYTQIAIAAPTGGGGIIMYNYSAAIDYQNSAEKIVGTPVKEKIIVKNTGTGRLNPGTLTMTLSPEYFALNLADPVWKSYNSDTGVAVWETPALDYVKEYLLEIELLSLKAGENIITSLIYHTINTEVSASATETIKPAVEEEMPLDATPKEESLGVDILAGETTGGNETTGTAAESPVSTEESSSSSSEETVSPESPGTASFSAETEEGRIAGESSDDTIEETTKEEMGGENSPSSLLQSGNESEESEARGVEADEEILTEEKDKEGEDKNVKEIIQGVIFSYWWLGALMIILGLLGYYYLGGKRKSEK